MVSDDGHGFMLDVLDDTDSSHLGLLSMRERTNLLGGHFEVQSALRSGT